MGLRETSPSVPFSAARPANTPGNFLPRGFREDPFGCRCDKSHLIWLKATETFKGGRTSFRTEAGGDAGHP